MNAFQLTFHFKGVGVLLLLGNLEDLEAQAEVGGLLPLGPLLGRGPLKLAGVGVKVGAKEVFFKIYIFQFKVI